jgi:hypothetical protein
MLHLTIVYEYGEGLLTSKANNVKSPLVSTKIRYE